MNQTEFFFYFFFFMFFYSKINTLAFSWKVFSLLSRGPVIPPCRCITSVTHGKGDAIQ